MHSREKVKASDAGNVLKLDKRSFCIEMKHSCWSIYVMELATDLTLYLLKKKRAYYVVVVGGGKDTLSCCLSIHFFLTCFVQMCGKINKINKINEILIRYRKLCLCPRRLLVGSFLFNRYRVRSVEMFHVTATFKVVTDQKRNRITLLLHKLFALYFNQFPAAIIHSSHYLGYHAKSARRRPIAPSTDSLI